MKIKTSELSGRALDWAVAKSMGWRMIDVPPDIDGKNGGQVLAPPTVGKDWKFPNRGKVGQCYFVRRWSTDWSHGGPLIDSFKLSVYASKEPETGKTHHWVSVDELANERRGVVGPTPLVAVCRALVFKRHGEYVDIPDDLVVA